MGAVKNSDIIAHAENAATEYENAKNKENKLLAEYLDEIEANLPGGSKNTGGSGVLTDGPVTNTYGEDWTYAYIYNGTSWEGPKEKANGDTAEGQIVAKFYKQTYRVDPGSFTYKGYTMDPVEGEAYKLAIEGTGAMGNFIDMTSMPPIGYAWKDNDVKALFGMPYEGALLSPYVTEVIICDGITDIGNYTFLGAGTLQNVVLSNTVEIIGSSSFEECSKLETISMSRGVNTIEYYAFYNCFCLSAIALPENLTTIEDYVFHNCSSLSAIDLPENLTTIGDRAFEKCTSLTEIIIPKGVTKISSFAFEDCTNLKNVIILADNIHIYTEVFRGCTNLRKVKIYATTLSCDASIGIAYMPEGSKVYVLDESFIIKVSGTMAGETIKATVQVVTKEQMDAL